MKIINIELPTCNRNNALFNYFLKNIHFFSPIKDFIDFSINFNGNITDDDVEACLKRLNELHFDVYWQKNKYVFEQGKHDIVKIREETHKINPNVRPLTLILDDDIEFMSEDYVKEVTASAYYMLTNPRIGSVTFNNMYHTKKNTVSPMDMNFKAWTHGGVLLRNITEWDGLIPPRCQGLFGCLDDVLMVFERIVAGYEVYGVCSQGFNHYEHRTKDNYVPGFRAHKWNFSFGEPGSVVDYLSKKGVGGSGALPKDIWKSKPYWKDDANVFDFSNMTLDDLKEKISSLKDKRVCNIEMPTCEKVALKRDLFAKIDYLKPLAEYSTFCINFQKDYTESDMQQICHRLRCIGFDVKSVYHDYENPYWNLFREDTHKLNPDCKVILTLDDDTILVNEDIAKDYLMAIYKILEDEEVGVVGIETANYHRSKNKNRNTIFPADMTHQFTTDVGMFVKNIPEWNGIVKEDIQKKIGCHHDNLISFERLKHGYKGYFINTDNAQLDFTKEDSITRYDWLKTTEDPNSVENYLKQYSTSNLDINFFSNSLWTKEKYWETEKSLDYKDYSIEEIQGMIDKVLDKN